MIDEQVLMERFGSIDMIVRFYSCFCEQLPSLLEPVQQAVENQNSKELEETAHRLKGSVANFSTGPAYVLAAELEQMGREQKSDSIPEKIDSLRLSLESFKKEMEEFIETNKV